eukprot:3084998-Pleurochrysis_carterae.AAC.1
MKLQPAASMRLRCLGDLAICSWGTCTGQALQRQRALGRQRIPPPGKPEGRRRKRGLPATPARPQAWMRGGLRVRDWHPPL